MSCASDREQCTLQHAAIGAGCCVQHRTFNVYRLLHASCIAQHRPSVCVLRCVQINVLRGDLACAKELAMSGAARHATTVGRF